MIVMMVISLFTTRITFRILGVDNYGIYNIVGGIIVFFLNSATLLSIKLFKYLSNKKLPRILPCRRIHLS